jgi:glycine C-acetyltransferase
MVGEVDNYLHPQEGSGGAAGGFAAATEAVCDYLTQRARPQLFSMPPPTVAASALASIQYLEKHPGLVENLRQNCRYFREQLLASGFNPLPGETPIIPVILGETALAIDMSRQLLEEGVFVTGFGYPVVPQGQARIRCQISAAHTRADLDQALEAIRKVGRRLAIV